MTRALIDTEFAWMKESTKEPAFSAIAPGGIANLDDYWVRPTIRDVVRNRLGLKRTTGETPQVESGESRATTDPPLPPGH